jgi:hypothetical protein
MGAKAWRFKEMKKMTALLFVFALFVAILIPLAGCQKAQEEKSLGDTAEEAMGQVQDDAEAAAADMGEAAADMGDAVEGAVEEGADAVDDAADTVKEKVDE